VMASLQPSKDDIIEKPDGHDDLFHQPCGR
jgi:hypothetical protein